MMLSKEKVRMIKENLTIRFTFEDLFNAYCASKGIDDPAALDDERIEELETEIIKGRLMMRTGEYFITPYIVELMQNQIPFMVFYNNQLLEGDEIDEWNGIHSLTDPAPRMLGHHITDKNRRSGYILKDTRVLYDLTIPDEIIMEGYQAVIDAAKELGIYIVGE